MDERIVRGIVTPEMLSELQTLPRVFLAVPSMEWTWTAAAFALMELGRHLPPGSAMSGPVIGARSIAAKRNVLVQCFLEFAEEAGIDYMLWVDSDMTPHADTVVKLLRSAIATSADIISASCFSRVPPFFVVHGPLPGVKTISYRGVEEVAQVGMACTLVHRRVVERMSFPWFQHTDDNPGYGEDYYHCNKARELGFRVFLDNDVECGHLAVLPMTRELATAWATTHEGIECYAEVGRQATGVRRGKQT